MEFRTIVAVTQLPGLYQLISTKNDGAFVKSLSDQSIKFISARVHHVTPLESIEIYTDADNVKLYQVLETIQEKEADLAAYLTKEGKLTANEAGDFFAAVLPSYDRQRVYNNDINKIAKWFTLLKNNDALHFEYLKEVYEAPVAAEAASEPTAAETQEEPVKEEAKPKKKTTKTTKAQKAEGEEGEEKPKKTTRKKKDTAAE